MAVYTDGTHLIADTIPELMEYGDAVGLEREWLQLGGISFHPHYDIFGKVKIRVLKDKSVIRVSSREIVRLCAEFYDFPETEEELYQWEMKYGRTPTPSEEWFKGVWEDIKAKLKKGGTMR
jgi:hypothetical protein